MQGPAVTHLSIRVPWHDRRWDGHVCNSPGNNHSCIALRAIAETRNDALEDTLHDKVIDDLDQDKKPPCLQERGTFLSGREHSLRISMAYASWSDAHKHITPTPVRMPAWGATLLPYRWLLREHAFKIAEQLGLDASREKEPEEPAFLKKTSWVQNHENQRALLDGFSARCVPDSSLTFFYAKRTPLSEEDRRVIVAVGLLKHKSEVGEYKYEGGSAGNRLHSMIWERPIQHSIRPDGENPGHFVGGIVLPYHAILERAAEDETLDTNDFLAYVPDDARDQFSYASEHVSHGVAITSLLSCKAALEKASKHLSGPWPQQIAWIEGQINRLWKLQGPCPGLGSALSALEEGFNGTLFALALSDQLSESDDPWKAVEQIFTGARPVPPGAPKVTKMMRRRWDHLHKEEPKRAILLRLLSRFELTSEQAVRYFEDESLTDSILKNPYLLYERDRLDADPIGLWTIDRGVFPDDEIIKKHPLPKECEIDPDEPDDPHRLRAACISILEKAASQEGHTLLNAPRVQEAARELPATRPIPLDATSIKLCRDEFSEEIDTRDEPGAGGLAVQLKRYSEYGEIIRRAIADRINRKTAAPKVDWPGKLKAAFGHVAKDDREEEKAREEKANALNVLAGGSVSVVIGAAGTGKTTVLRLLLEQTKLVGSGVVLLAPTGKARVRLGQQTKLPEKTRTLAQFLLEYRRYDGDTGRYFPDARAPLAEGVTTCVIDEASMLTEDQIAGLVSSLPVSARIIFVGDPRQLPPIGAGRPFVDLISHLQRDHQGKGVAELTVRRRQGARSASGKKLRDLACADIQLADLFSGRTLPPGEDEILESVLAGRHDERLKVTGWRTPSQLRDVIDAVLAEELSLEKGNEENGISMSLGGTPSNGHVYFNPGPAVANSEDWQVLTPHRTQPSGSVDLNRHIKMRFREKTLAFARSSNEGPPYYLKYRMISPRGPEQVTYGDKVICIRNHERQGYRYSSKVAEDGYLANGEIGVVIGEAYKAKERPYWTKVLFASQPEHTYSFGKRDFTEEGSPILELAYAVMVHKAQGSEFGKVFLVLPARSRILSREMLYTALTRQTDRVVILHQGGLEHLRAYRSPFYSEVARRLTNLFDPPSMIEVTAPAGAPPGKVGRTFLEEKLIHRSARGDLVSSKSEVVIADALFDAEQRLGIRYYFERQFVGKDGRSRWPDFTIEDRKGETWLWEHCGMLDQPDYAARWNAKRKWYHADDYEEWSPTRKDGRLLVTEDGPNAGLDSKAIRSTIQSLFGGG